ASSSGANSAKFQLIIADEICTPDYQHYGLFQNLQMPTSDWIEIFDLSRDLKINLILDVFGLESLGLAQEVGVTDIMLHATDLNSLELLNAVSHSNVRRVLLGVGGGFLDEIFQAVKILNQQEVALIFGFQSYPTPQDHLNLKRISVVKEILGDQQNHIRLGYADHSVPESDDVTALSAMAMALGATIVEKHLTLGECMKLEDYESALNPDRFALYTKALNSLSHALGGSSRDNDFLMSDSEKLYRKNMRRHVTFSRNLEAGSLITSEDICLKRTSSVTPFYRSDDVVGTRVISAVSKNQVVTEGVIDRKG
ncbi:N-acetylneuraminate synthase family protein, partial [Alphaproteobacteria bacterium]|nr:N-acetylneuraminate synthase family protein [Alphaproteobacteria bacterium]